MKVSRLDEVKNCAACWNALSHCIYSRDWGRANRISETLSEIKTKSKKTYYLGKLLRFFFI